MVADFDVIDFLHVLTDRSVALLDVEAAGLLLADPRGELRVVAASSEAARLIELFQLQNDQGPCLDCYRSGQPVHAADLAAVTQRWPRFVPAARQAGFTAVQALPMRLREQVIGALRSVLTATPDPGSDADIYRRYAIGLYRQALFGRRGHVLGTRARHLAASVRATLRRTRDQGHES
jgi:hypothetical protein